MNEILKRFLTAVIAGGTLVTVLVLSSWGSWVFGIVVGQLGLYEFYRMTGVKSQVGKWFMLGVGVAIWLYLAFFVLFPISIQASQFALVIETNLLVISMLLFSITAIILLFERQVTAPALEMSTLAFGFLYAYLPMVLLFLLSLDPTQMADSLDFKSMEMVRDQHYNFRIPLGILMIGWGMDTAAYFGGRFIGGKKLFERISPNKTWAGAICGAAASIAVGFWLNAMWTLAFSWIVVSVIIAIFGQLGDLVESSFKRGLQVKDSGGILPGHGGMLDRFDGVFLSVPVIYLYYLIRFVLDFGSI
ncbi:MAG: phosphatidate cytidylyltransferase [Bacteroidota bacterium]